jgi:hypothetical protein
VDWANNVSDNSNTVQIQIASGISDTTPPTVAFTSPANGATVSGLVTLTWNESDNVGVWVRSLTIDGEEMLGVQAASYTWNFANYVNGPHRAKITVWDAVGNSASSNITLNVGTGGVSSTDTTLPVVSITSPSSGQILSGSVTVQVAATDNVAVAKVQLSVDGTVLASSMTAPYTFSLDTTTLSNASHVLTATATDTSGNAQSASLSVTVSNNVDTTPPSVSITSPSPGQTLSGSVSVQVAASDNVAVLNVQLSVDGTLVATSSTAPYVFPLDTTTLTNAAHTLTAKAVDTSGNTQSASITVTVSNVVKVVDTQPPVVNIVSPSNGGKIGKNLSISVKATDNVAVASVSLYVDGAFFGSSTSASTSFSVNPKKLSTGAHTFQAKATDTSGNVGISTTITLYK